MSAASAFTDRVAACGGCGAQLVFEVGSSQVKVCEFCQYVSVRTPQGIESRGKVAAVIPTGARLAQGAVGIYQGTSFRLAGRLQLGWAQGAWDEWHVAFEDGRWGWLAEAGGRYFISFLSSQDEAPSFEAVRPGAAVSLPGFGRFVVTDAREAWYVGASGELPEVFPLDGSVVRLADLSGEDGAFATFDYGQSNDAPPAVFVGREVTLEDLRIETEHLHVELARTSARELVCPHCKAPLELINPGEAVRVTCSHCASLLSLQEGELGFVAALRPPPLQWKLGSRAQFDGRDYRVAGWMERECHVDGEAYSWEEYLLYDAKRATYRYLVVSDGHWSFVTPISAGDVKLHFRHARWKGIDFKPFSSTVARVKSVWGEFPWAVTRGETVRVTDYIAPPVGLSEERSASETVWSHARYLPPSEVWEGFGLAGVEPPKAQGVAAMQPNPWKATAKETARFAAFACLAALVVFVLLAMRASNAELVKMSVTLQPGQVIGGDEPLELPPELAGSPNHTSVVFSEPFRIARSGRNLRIRMRSNVRQSWVWVQGSLFDEGTGEVRSFDMESSNYWGRDSDGSWVEDKLRHTKFLSSMPEGTWVLRVEAQWPKNAPPPEILLNLTSSVARGSHFFFVVFLLILPPAFFALRAAIFEGARWQQATEAG